MLVIEIGGGSVVGKAQGDRSSTSVRIRPPRSAHIRFKPDAGSVHDAKAFREHGLDNLFNESNAFADKGYVGCGVTAPLKKPAGGELLDWQQELNKAINQHRYIIERAIANFKTWRIMHTAYRRPLRTYETAFSAVRALHFFKLGFR